MVKAKPPSQMKGRWVNENSIRYPAEDAIAFANDSQLNGILAGMLYRFFARYAGVSDV